MPEPHDIPKPGEPDLSDVRAAYTTAETVYLQFVEWREKTFAGFIGLSVLLAAAFGWTVINVPQLQWMPAAVGAVVSLVLLTIESRTRWLINMIEETGRDCERTLRIKGFFSRLQRVDDGEEAMTKVRKVYGVFLPLKLIITHPRRLKYRMEKRLPLVSHGEAVSGSYCISCLIYVVAAIHLSSHPIDSKTEKATPSSDVVETNRN